jgi:hypothetical protein
LIGHRTVVAKQRENLSGGESNSLVFFYYLRPMPDSTKGASRKRHVPPILWLILVLNRGS